jgi:hypothetical protein
MSFKDSAYNRLDESLRATNVISADYRGHIMAWAGKVAEEAADGARRQQRQADLDVLNGMIEPDGYDERTVREVLRRMGVGR